MKIAIINHYAGSPVLGMEYRPYYLAREWQKKGHAVVVIAASHSHVRTHQPQVSSSLQVEQREGVEYVWIKTPPYEGNSVRRIFNMLIFVIKTWWHASALARKYNFDVVIASSTYPLDIYPARRMASACKAPLVFEVHDLWPLSPMELGGYSKYHPFIATMQMAENYAYRHSSAVISMLPCAKEYMMAHGLAPEKFFYVPNGICRDDWNQRKKLPPLHAETLQKEREKGRLLVGYAGTLGLANALYSLIEAARILQEEKVTFILTGQGPEKENLIRKTREHHLSNVIFLPPVEKTMVPELLEAMDVLYLGLQNQSLFRFGVSPNKLFDYMMAGKPVIQAIRAGNDLVGEAGCGYTIEPENAEALAMAIRKIKSLPPDEQKKMGEAGKQYVLKNHTYEVLAEKFIAVLTRLAQRNEGR